jgi:hypothetical protein
MFEQVLSALTVALAVSGGNSIFTQGTTSMPGKTEDRPPIRYKAADGVPKDKAAEKRRDYVLLEASLNDLASPGNPEHKEFIQDHGVRRQIVIDVETCDADVLIDLKRLLHVGYKVSPSITTEILEDFKRRNQGPVRSLTDFEPANANILLRDLEKEFKGTKDPFFKRYPAAWGYVRAYAPGYSKNGEAAMVVFVGGPSAHMDYWVYMLSKKGDRWEVQWRHLEHGK